MKRSQFWIILILALVIVFGLGVYYKDKNSEQVELAPKFECKCPVGGGLRKFVPEGFNVFSKSTGSPCPKDPSFCMAYATPCGVVWTYIDYGPPIGTGSGNREVYESAQYVCFVGWS